LKRVPGQAVVGTIRSGVRTIAYPQLQSAVWEVPARLPRGKLRFCVIATDAAGNRSVPGCAPFELG
jgi:hypothetical protein